jgi:hypothetical protein
MIFWGNFLTTFSGKLRFAKHSIEKNILIIVPENLEKQAQATFVS